MWTHFGKQLDKFCNFTFLNFRLEAPFKDFSDINPAGREISTPGGTKLWQLCHKFTFTFEYIKMSQSLPNYVDNIIKPFFT